MRLFLTILFYCCLTAVLSGAPAVMRTPWKMTLDEFEKTRLPAPGGWQRLEARVPVNLNGCLYRLPAGSGWFAYARTDRRDDWFVVSRQSDGALVFADAEAMSAVYPEAGPGGDLLEWRFFQQGAVLSQGGCLIKELRDCAGWEFFWIPGGAEARIAQENIYKVDLEDGFMRLKFGDGDRWSAPAGTWRLKQYGGGMPTTDAEARNAGFRRASNPFTLVGSAAGTAVYGQDDWINLYCEGRFFFGRPFSYAKRDAQTGTRLGGEPSYADMQAIYSAAQIQEYPESDFFIGQGRPGGFQVSFGWSVAGRCFQLRRRDPGEGNWQIVRSWPLRPFFTNWTRVGLGVLRGCRAMPFLDGEQLGSFNLERLVTGPIFLLSGAKEMEADDIAAWSYPEPRRLGAPVFEQSAVFAQKELLPRKDTQTGQWTRSEMTFAEDEAVVGGRRLQLLRCQFPLYGDFTYQPTPLLPPGDYFLALVDEKDRAYYRLSISKTEAGWVLPGGGAEYGLQIARRGGTIARFLRGRWEPLAARQVKDTMWLVIGSVDGRGLNPEYHMINSRNLEHCLFEKAPTEWAWREGNFRMDVRWQCQRGWNFMMGKSRDLAVMFSRNSYEGDQEVEYYKALRFVIPPPYYVRRDMGFAFCTDGRSLASGYAVIYGDENNTKTTLLRQGVPVMQAPGQISTSDDEAILHNYWWHCKVVKKGARVIVEIDGKVIFDFVDKQPLKGGHVAFWTLRNAMSLAKVSVNAASIQPRPELFRLPVAPYQESLWEPRNPDEVAIKALPSGRWQAENLVGGGTFAVRCRLPDGGVDLRGKNRLQLPLELGRDAMVGLHMQISGRSFYLPLGAPAEGIRGLLTPSFENATPQQIFAGPVLSQEQIRNYLVQNRGNARDIVVDLAALVRDTPEPRLESLVVGNSSNFKYLLLGAGGNPPGATYVVGTPVLR